MSNAVAVATRPRGGGCSGAAQWSSASYATEPWGGRARSSARASLTTRSRHRLRSRALLVSAPRGTVEPNPTFAGGASDGPSAPFAIGAFRARSGSRRAYSADW
eukprot:CAMPEP_0179839116 /NCGR_PEP_ID=MMETSP0982-20121206/1120_1 /TAXON_ID=483367 /ORGANISM="non described non described, Strain CCMP 2436" /LENGTH=103 /DNA_ID=CAMNT_0021722697 /DNA_START=199 /DNA_END=507 /DNA_ORIENTATION=+